jgi:cytochrome bd-type quinol oxidase subunit 2
MKKYIIIITLLVSCAGFSYAGITRAQIESGTIDEIDGQVADFNEFAGYEEDAEIGGVMSSVIKGFLGLLGIIFLVLMLYAGYNWMIARGDEARVEKAKDTIQRALIGIIITIAAYAITSFVFNALEKTGN